jgi:hypothetical protein
MIATGFYPLRPTARWIICFLLLFLIFVGTFMEGKRLYRDYSRHAGAHRHALGIDLVQFGPDHGSFRFCVWAPSRRRWGLNLFYRLRHL